MMNVSELFRLTKWIGREIEGEQVPQLYQALAAKLQQHAQPNRPKEPFEEEKENLLSMLRQIPIEKLTSEQMDFLRAMGIAPFIGNEGVQVIEDALFRNVIDVATSATLIQEAAQSIVQGISRAHQLEGGLEGCVEEEDLEPTNEVIMRVSFSGEAGMENVVDFKKWAKTWHEIGRGITMAHGKAPEDMRIVGATRGSIVIEFATIMAIATTAGKVIKSALEIAERVLQIRKTAEEIRGLKLQNDGIANDLEREIDEEKKLGIKRIQEELLGDLGVDKSTEGDKRNELDKSVKLLVGFVELGGEVDFVLPVEDEDSESAETGTRPDYHRLRATSEEIRRLEGQLRRLGRGEV